MIERILPTHEEIAAVVLSTKSAPLPFHAEEINVLKDMEEILSLFQQVSETISICYHIAYNSTNIWTYSKNQIYFFAMFC